MIGVLGAGVGASGGFSFNVTRWIFFFQEEAFLGFSSTELRVLVLFKRYGADE